MTKQHFETATRVCLLALFASAFSANGAVVSWNFGTAAPSAGVPVTGLTVGEVTRGNNNGTTTLLTTTSVSENYTGASGTSNAGAAARVGVLSTGENGSAYFEFTLAADFDYTFSLTEISFGTRSTSTGPQAYTLRSNADSYAADLATGTIGNNGAWSLKSNASLTSQSSNGGSITYRLFGHSGAGSAFANTANWRIDDLSLTVAATFVPVPEPETYALVAGVGLVGFGLWRRTRRA
jgi:hypothetical protein